MKIQAKDLKVGQTIKDGVWTMKIEKIENDTQKNGTPLKQVYGKATRKAPKGFRGFVYQNLEQSRAYKELTFINII